MQRRNHVRAPAARARVSTRRGGARGLPTTPAIALLGALAALSTLTTGLRAATLLVPEEYTLSAGLAAAAPGDTVSIAAGTYPRVPPDVVKPITILGRGSSRPELPGLRAGRCRIEGISFRSTAGPAEQAALLVALDSLTVSGCDFEATFLPAITADDATASTPWRLRVTNCAFDNLARLASLTFSSTNDSRTEFEACAFSTSFDGILLSMPAVACADGASPPPFEESAARLRITNCEFKSIAHAAVEARHAASAVVLSGGRVDGCGVGLDLLRAGALVDHVDLEGVAAAGIGIRAASSRLTVRGGSVTGFDLGIVAPYEPGCEKSEGLIGGSLLNSVTVAGSRVNLAVADPIPAEYNYWGTTDCALVMAKIDGQTVRKIYDDLRIFVTDCLTPVVPATWGLIKALHRD